MSNAVAEVIEASTARQLETWTGTSQQLLDHLLSQLWSGGGALSPFDMPGDLTMPNLLPYQIEFLEAALDPEGPQIIAVWGGIGCGKSVVLSILAWMGAMLYPGSVSMMSTDPLTNLMAINRRMCDELGRAHPDDKCKFTFGKAAQYVGAPANEFRFSNGSIVMMRPYNLPAGWDEAKNPWEGRTVNRFLIIDEAQKLALTFLQHAIQRSRGLSLTPMGDLAPPKIIVNGRPGAETAWIKRCVELGAQVFRPKTKDNVHNGTQYLAALRRAHTPQEFACLTEGAEMPVKGAMYSDFSEEPWPKGNLLPGYGYDPDLLVTVGIDFGINNPAVIFFQDQHFEHPDTGETHTLSVAFDEWQPVGTDTTVPQLVLGILSKGYNLAWAAVDPAGNARNAQTGRSDISILRRPVGFRARDGMGGGLGCPIRLTTDSADTGVAQGCTRVGAKICSAENPPQRTIVVTEGLWLRGKNAPSGTNSLYATILKYSKRMMLRKARGGSEDPVNHMADALRYYVINKWGAFGHGGGGYIGGASTAEDVGYAEYAGGER